ncbi:MAG TPA: hypothetical protein VGE76_17885, partial [Opitutaceae bacterium]
GVVENGDRNGRKILYVGDGDQELGMMRIVARSGWRGPVGILCHRTDVDAKEALQRNLDGVARLAALLAGELAAAAPKK